MANLIDITEDELLKKITEQSPDAVVKEFRDTPLSSTMLAVLYDENKENIDVALFLATYPNTPSRILNRIAMDWPDEPVLCRLALHERTQADILQKLAVSEFLSVRKCVACNKTITPQTVSVLIRDVNAVVRAMVAENSTQYQSSQLQQACDKSACVVTALAANKKCSEQSKQLMFEHESPFVKLSLAAVVPLDEDKLLELSDSNEFSAQNALFLRGGLSPDVLESLSFSRHKSIALKAISLKRLDADELLGWAKHDDKDFRVLIAGRTLLPEVVQEILAEDSCVEVRETLAENRSVSLVVSVKLSEDSSEKVLTNLAGNPAVELSVVSRLCESDNPLVHKIIALRKDVGTEQLDILLNEKHSEEVAYIAAAKGLKMPQLSLDMTKKLARSELPTVRVLAAGSGNLMPTEMARLAYDTYAPVLSALIENENINDMTLQYLAKHHNPDVAQAAAEKLKIRTELNEKNKPSERGLISKVLKVIKR